MTDAKKSTDTTGAELLVRTLVAGGVQTVFNLSGNQIMPLYTPLVQAGIRLLHTRHEAGAVHMADAYARLTEKPCVALVSAGPGHANTPSAMYTALKCQSAVILLSGHSELANTGLGAFQEMDQISVIEDVSKAAWICNNPGGLGDDIMRAFHVASSGNPGPVSLNLPADVIKAPVTAVASPSRDDFTARISAAPDGQLHELLDMLKRAKSPIILAGPAMARASRWRSVQRLSEAFGIPAIQWESPRGPDDPSLGGIKTVLPHADLILLLGLRTDFTLKFGRPPVFSVEAKFVMVGHMPATGVQPKLAIRADPHAVVDALFEHATERVSDDAWRKRIADALVLGRDGWDAIVAGDASPLHPLRVVVAACRRLGDGDVFVSDGGEFAQWAQAGLAYTGKQVDRVINGPSGGIGNAISFAVGACFARPDARVVAFMGDGGAGFLLGELDTAARARCRCVYVIGNDNQWNAEVVTQREMGREPLACLELPGVRYDRVAEALGMKGERVESASELDAALERAFAHDGPVLLDVVISGVDAPYYDDGNE